MTRDNLYIVQRLKLIFSSGFQKSIATSTKLREKANEAYKTGKYSKALRGYNLAIMFAPINSEELGLAHGNRSALFLQINEPHSTLKDIELALNCPHSDNLKCKLLDRRRKSNDLISRKCSDWDVKNQSRSIGRKYCEEHVLRLKSHNPSVTNAEEFVTIDYTKERGRRLVVSKNIPAG